jgi:hypothetical protein
MSEKRFGLPHNCADDSDSQSASAAQLGKSKFNEHYIGVTPLRSASGGYCSLDFFLFKEVRRPGCYSDDFLNKREGFALFSESQ